MRSSRSPKPSIKRLDHPYYEKPALDLARDLIGKLVVRCLRGREFRARIVETEAYLGEQDLASHASKGLTNRTKVMYGPAGHAYVYLIYGLHCMFNIVAAAVDDPQAVLIRAAEPLDGWTVDLSGPGRFARGFEITRALNGLDLTGDELYLAATSTDRPAVIATPRIGVDFAKEWKRELLRFVDPNSSALSHRKELPRQGK